MLPADEGMINLDVVNGRIVYIEFLYRPDVKRIVDAENSWWHGLVMGVGIEPRDAGANLASESLRTPLP